MHGLVGAPESVELHTGEQFELDRRYLLVADEHRLAISGVTSDDSSDIHCRAPFLSGRTKG